MIKAFLLLFEPMQTWDKVARAQRATWFLLLIYLLPMIVITGAAEGYGLVTKGKLNSEYNSIRKFTVAEAVVYETLQGLLYLAIALIAAKTLKSLGETFHGRHTYRQAFTTIAYGLSPLFVARLFDGFPASNQWVTWGIGIFFCVVILYQGLPRVMLPDPPHAFGLYLMNSLLLVLITGLARALTWMYVTGRLRPVDQFISAIAAKLPL